MSKLKLTLFAGGILLSSHGFAQQYVPPPPSRPSTGRTIIQAPGGGTKVYAPNAPEIKFKNGARVVIYRDKIVLIEPDGTKYPRRRPFPEVARNPWGCKWLRNYLDTRDPHTRNWGDSLIVYLKHCEGWQ